MTEESNDDNRQQKTISPYDIITFDNPGHLITQVPLKGENDDEWARLLRTTTLRMRKKIWLY